MVPQLADGDVDLYRRYALDLTRYATSLVGPDEAADVVTDAVMSAFATPNWRSVEHPRAYLYKAVYHRAIEVQRATTRRERREVAAVMMRPPVLDEPSASVDVFRAMSGLSPQQRAVVFLTYWEDLTPSAVSKLLDVSDGAVRKQLARAREHLRGVLS